MFGAMIGYALGYDAGRSDEQTGNRQREIVHQILYGERPVTVDQSYIDQLHAALAEARADSAHNTITADQFHAEALDWKQKADQFRNEALYWRDEKFAPVRAKAKARREENAVLQERNRRSARRKRRSPRPTPRAQSRPRRRAGRSRRDVQGKAEPATVPRRRGRR